MRIADIQLNPCEFHLSTTIVMDQFNCIGQIQSLVFNELLIWFILKLHA